MEIMAISTNLSEIYKLTSTINANDHLYMDEWLG